MKRFPSPAALAAGLLAAALPGVVAAQARPVAIRNVRVLTMTGPAIESATVVFRDGKITAIGPDVEVPVGADVVEGKGGTLMPGLVSAYSHAGLHQEQEARPDMSRFRRGRGGMRGFGRPGGGGPKATNQAAKKVVDGLYARQDVFGELLAGGVTTLGLAPEGKGFPGIGAVLDPAGKTIDALAVDDDAFVAVVAEMGTSNKKLFTDTLKQAAELVAERKKPAAPEPKPAEEEKKAEDAAKGEAQPGDKGGDEKKEEKKEEKGGGEKKEGGTQEPGAKAEAGAAEKEAEKKPPDPNLEVLADLLEGKRRAMLEIDSAAQLVHFASAIEGVELPKSTVVWSSYDTDEGLPLEVVDRLKGLGSILMVDPDLASPAYSRAIINPAAELAAAGFEVGFILPDDQRSLRSLFFGLMELVRCGLAPDAALAAVTAVPAKALGLDGKVGSIGVDKQADLLLWTGDPLEPTSRLVRVWHAGNAVETAARTADAGGER